jgi:hypothetical protein
MTLWVHTLLRHGDPEAPGAREPGADIHDLLKTGPARGPVLQVLDDLHGFRGSRVEGWVHDDDVVQAYNQLRGTGRTGWSEARTCSTGSVPR